MKQHKLMQMLREMQMSRGMQTGCSGIKMWNPAHPPPMTPPSQAFYVLAATHSDIMGNAHVDLSTPCDSVQAKTLFSSCQTHNEAS